MIKAHKRRPSRRGFCKQATGSLSTSLLFPQSEHQAKQLHELRPGASPCYLYSTAAEQEVCLYGYISIHPEIQSGVVVRGLEEDTGYTNRGQTSPEPQRG